MAADRKGARGGPLLQGCRPRGTSWSVALRDDEKLRAAPDVLSRTLDGEAVLLDLQSGTYFGLNEVGTHIWERVVAGDTVAEIRAHVLDYFDTDAATVERDLEELVAELTARKLVLRQG
jgi:hypothetical protein